MAITSQYNPFTFEEMLSAVNIADSQHKAMEEQMAALATEASVWESLANNDKDRDAYNQYKAYATDLESKVQELAKSGLNPRSRQGFNQMRKRYGSEIAPITNAYNTRQKWIDEQRQYAAKLGGNARFSVNADEVGLGELMRDPSMTYNAWSGDAIAKTMGDLASTFQNEIRDPNSKYSVILKGALGPARFQRMIQNGLSIQDVFDTFNGTAEGNAILKDMFGSTLEQFDYANQKEDIQSWMWENAERGAYQAVGKQQLDAINNPDYDWYQSIDLLNRKTAAAQKAEEERVNAIRQNRTRNVFIEEKEYDDSKKVFDAFNKSIEETDSKGNVVNVSAADAYRKVENIDKSISDVDKKMQSIRDKYGADKEVSFLGVPIWGAASSGIPEDKITQPFERLEARERRSYEMSKELAPLKAEKERLENQKKTTESRYKEILPSNREIKKLRELAGVDESTSVLDAWSNYNQNNKPLVYDYTLTDLNAKNSAGDDFKNDMLRTLNDNVKLSKGWGNIKQLGITELDKRLNPTKEIKGKKLPVFWDEKTGKSDISTISISPKSFGDEKTLIVQTNDGDLYSVPARLFGNRTNEVLNSYAGQDMGALVNNLMGNGYYDEAQDIVLSLGDEINKGFKYNFYQRQGDTDNNLFD